MDAGARPWFIIRCWRAAERWRAWRQHCFTRAGKQLPLRQTADALAAPLALGLAFEQLGALLAGSGYGTEATVRWAVTYTNPLAARWSGTPLGIPLHPVQAYAALAFLTLSILLLLSLPARRQQGDVAGLFLMGTGVAVFVTEFWRDPEGRGALLGGALDGPQAAAVVDGAGWRRWCCLSGK